MKELILKSDILGPNPSLKIHKNKRHSSIPGGIISILAFFLILTVAIYFIERMLSRSDKTITFNVFPTESQSFDFSKVPIIFIFTDYLGFPLKNVEKYFRTYVATWDIKQNNNTIITTPTFLKFEKCDINKHFSSEHKFFFENIPFLSDHICINPDQKFFLNNTFASIKGFSTFSIYLQICSNNTSQNKTNCYEESRIQRELSGMYFNIKFLEYSFNHSNIDSPGNLYLRSDAIPVSPSVYKKEIYTVKQVEYISDYGFIQESKDTKNYYYLSDNKESTDLSPDANSHRTFVYYQFTMDPKTESYTRIFMKAQTLLANIGGVIKGVLVSCEILTTIFLKELYYIDLISALFNINNKKMEEKMQSRLTIVKINEGKEKALMPLQTFKSSNNVSKCSQSIQKKAKSTFDQRYFLFKS
jgi:hypothetical protein